MTTERTDFDMIYLKGKVYAVGGTGGSRSENSMDIFDSTTRTWKKQSIPFSVSNHCITQLSANQFLLIGGISRGVSKNGMKKNISIEQSHFFTFHGSNFFTNYLFLDFRFQLQLGFLMWQQIIGQMVPVFRLKDLTTDALESRTTA